MTWHWCLQLIFLSKYREEYNSALLTMDLRIRMSTRKEHPMRKLRGFHCHQRDTKTYRVQWEFIAGLEVYLQQSLLCLLVDELQTKQPWWQKQHQCCWWSDWSQGVLLVAEDLSRLQLLRWIPQLWRVKESPRRNPIWRVTNQFNNKGFMLNWLIVVIYIVIDIF